MYEEVALEPEREFHFETGRALADGSATRRRPRPHPGAGASSPSPASATSSTWPRSGRRPVLDLGSGSGTDSFIAALAAGRVVIGVDMTAAQLAKARAARAGQGFENVEFREGYIERPPVEDGSSTA